MTLFHHSISLNWSWICFCNSYSAPGRSGAKRSPCKAELSYLQDAGWKGDCFCWRLCAFGWCGDVGKDYIVSLNRILLHLTGIPAIMNYKIKNLIKMRRNLRNSSTKKIICIRQTYIENYLEVWNRTNTLSPCWESSELSIGLFAPIYKTRI